MESIIRTNILEGLFTTTMRIHSKRVINYLSYYQVLQIYHGQAPYHPRAYIYYRPALLTADLTNIRIRQLFEL